VEDVYEPFLLRLGFLDRTPQGRIATDGARAHLARLGYEIPAARRSETDQPALWDGTGGTGDTADATGASGADGAPSAPDAPRR
jgi:hypothetical protein